MTRFSTYFLLAMMALPVASVAAAADTDTGFVCKDRSDIVARLAKDYAEAPVSMGVTDQGTILEILAGPDGNWTMIETLPSGQACLVANGQMWQKSPPATQPSNTSL